MIATASATTTSGQCYIHLWQWKPAEKQEIAGEGWSLLDIVDFLFKLVVLLAAAAYFVQQGRQIVGSVTGDMAIGGIKRVMSDMSGMGDTADVGGVVSSAKKVVVNTGGIGGVKEAGDGVDEVGNVENIDDTPMQNEVVEDGL